MSKIFNDKGEQVLTQQEAGSLFAKDLAKALRKYNRWRRGQGAYKWSEDPKKNKPCPYSPKTIGYLIDEAVCRLAHMPF